MSVACVKAEVKIEIDGLFCGRKCPFLSIGEEKFHCQLFATELTPTKGAYVFSIDRCDECALSEIDYKALETEEYKALAENGN